ncbi:MAG: hypothetical protein ACI8ZM_000123 [Crocinitomix sp.]|jgi:hypothetical protein
MFRAIITILFISPFFIFSQDESLETVLDQTCDCFKNVIKANDNKYDFDQAFGKCISYLSEGAKSIDSSYNSAKAINSLIHGKLKTSCKYFDKVDELQSKYSQEKENDFNVKVDDCQILKGGNYITLGDKDSTVINMTDSLQTVTFKDGTFTKSKIIWLGPCSYKIVRISSTNAYEAEMVKPGEERIVRIIGVEDKRIFTYELQANGRFYQAKLVKQ